MTTRKDTATTGADEFLTRVYQQLASTQGMQYAAAYDASAGQQRFADWLHDHAAAELDADQAMAQLYSQHYQSLIRLATLLVRDAVAAEEVVLDAFTAMHQGWPRLGTQDEALAYLRQAVVNRARSVLRHRTVTGTEPHERLPDTSGTEVHLLGLPAAWGVLNALPQRQREAVVLRYYFGLSEDQVAATMRISRGAAKSHAARGLSVLREAVRQAAPKPALPEDSGHDRPDP